MTWTINFDEFHLSNGKHRVETIHGAVRTGKVTKINWREIFINRKTVMIPVSLEIDNDNLDFITFDMIKRIDRVDGPNNTVRPGGTD